MMGKAIAGTTGLLALPLVALFGLATLAGSAASGSTAAGQARFDPSDEALGDIPALLLELYLVHADACVGLPWQVLAGIGKVESNHARFGGADIRPDGRVQPPIIGIALNGRNGTAAIADTDDGALDGDSAWDRAVGPFQFIPTSWRIYGRDGNGDGVRDPQNVFDAVPAAVAHLCPHGSVDDIEAAIFGYNRSTEYVDLVLDWAARYTGPLSAVGPLVGGYAYPVPLGYATEALAVRPHHDYPAFDVGLPVGTPLLAMTDGIIAAVVADAGVYTPGGTGRCGNTVILDGADGARYTYCHLSLVTVAAGTEISAGEPVGLSGGEPGTRGAGNTTGPHLHLSVRAYGQLVCPQPMLLGILRQTPIPPTAVPSTGCITGQPQTDWNAWLALTIQAAQT